MIGAPTLVDSAEDVDAFLSANENPAAVFADRPAFEAYFPVLGQVGYATRDLVWGTQYVPE
ncbi:hypothetical protein M4I32_13490 [Microbacterium sp. LRZ72]|uniref:hypothetical protein n=1 Tax=Microbacterium sp. LRZ72 TaxID=2942481 RepID=UPI0029B06589|nr:hypothetical protein [Microbacterium sp. LRZ72]MDX2377813.1 hypothetical protein [Microbacterium sp. LRZ72]